MGRAESHKPHQEAAGDEKLPLDGLRGRRRGTGGVAWQQPLTASHALLFWENRGGAGGPNALYIDLRCFWQPLKENTI